MLKTVKLIDSAVMHDAVDQTLANCWVDFKEELVTYFVNHRVIHQNYELIS